MKTIHKHTLTIQDNQIISLPKGSKILSIQAQKDMPTIWYEKDFDENETEELTIMTYGTGQTIFEDNLVFLGTYQIKEGELVFHVFIKSN